eukprot:c21238_g1_i1.p1 GENE.c21238_g1_i1~~c21238_g1_i1.p1  ORF type:complete len:462 (-),score=107.21 c21238_g1_i1:38-1387(-)
MGDVILEEQRHINMKSPAEATYQGHSPSLPEFSPPPDTNNMAYIIFYLLGCGALFPWNAFLTSLDFFDEFYPSVHAGFTFPFIFNTPNCTIGLFMIAFGYRFEQNPRVYGSLVAFCFCMQTISTMVLLQAEKNLDVALPILYFVIVVLGGAGAVGASTVLSVAAYFPPVYTQAYMGGQGVAGLVLGVLRIILKASFGGSRSGLRNGSLLYYELSVVILIGCIVGYAVLLKLPITKYYTQNHAPRIVRGRGGNPLKSLVNLFSSKKSQLLEDTDVPKPPSEFAKLKVAIKYMWQSGISVFAVFLVTLTVFPGLVCSMPATFKMPGDWHALMLVTVFMVGDVVSRVMASCFVIRSKNMLSFLVALRFVFVPFFLLPHLVDDLVIPDYVTIMVVFVMAVSNGHLCSLLMMFAAEGVPDEFKGMVGVIMPVCLSTGIFAGSLVAFGFHLAFDI